MSHATGLQFGVEGTQSPGPKSVHDATSTATPINSMRDRRDWLIQKHTAHKARIRTATNIAVGRWWVEWPDLSQTPEAPTVANQMELGIQHWGAVGGAILPSIRVPVNKTADRRTEKGATRKRERRLRELWESSNVGDVAARWWQDYSGTGSAVMAAWVNFEEKDLAKRNPYMMRFDPRHTYIIKDDLGNITELLVARRISKGELAAQHPQLKAMFEESTDDEVEEWFWYTRDSMKHVIVDVSKKGRKREAHIVLTDEPWPLDFLPVYEVTLPTFDGQRRGIFDQTIHILRTMQRLMIMTIQSTEEHAFPAVGYYDVVNPGDFGPGAQIQYRSSDSVVERLGPQSHFDVKDLVARLGEEAKTQSVYPQQLSGEPGASINSARGIKASMGALDARLAVAHTQFEIGFGRVSGFLLALDETFCDGDKTIVGDLRDLSDAESYRPSKDVNGAWVARCTYGLGAGSDPANVEMRLNMNLAGGLISKETARDQLPFLDDPDSEPVKIFREGIGDSISAGIFQLAATGQPELAASAWELLAKDDLSFDDVMAQLTEAIQAPAEQPAGPGPGEVVQGAESLARGGGPGAAQAPAAGAGLPPLGQVLGQDSRQVS